MKHIPQKPAWTVEVLNDASYTPPDEPPVKDAVLMRVSVPAYAVPYDQRNRYLKLWREAGNEDKLYDERDVLAINFWADPGLVHAIKRDPLPFLFGPSAVHVPLPENRVPVTRQAIKTYVRLMIDSLGKSPRAAWDDAHQQFRQVKATSKPAKQPKKFTARAIREKGKPDVE